MAIPSLPPPSSPAALVVTFEQPRPVITLLTFTAVPETVVFLSAALVFMAAAWRIKHR